jgi:ribonuclease-3
LSFIDKIRLSSIWEKEDEFTASIRKLTGYKPKNIDYYKTAFTHKSESKLSDKGGFINYERLEFLGDSLLDASVTAFLYHHLPDSKEGDLTQMRSKIVSREHLNEVGKDLDLVSLAKRPTSKRKFSYNAYGDLFEALIAAIYLDRGFDVMDKFVHKKLIGLYVDLDKLQGKISSYKSLFIEWCQKNHYDYTFDVFEDSGKDHEKHFGVKLSVNNEVISKGRSTSKKKAEEIACRRAYYSLQDKGMKL